MPTLTVKPIDQCMLPDLFDDPDGTYNYCPSYFEVNAGVYYVYYCSNKDYKSIRDHVIVRKGTREGRTVVWEERKIALAPSVRGWDEIHVCDPSVVAGSFNYNCEKYNYIMAYLGCATLDNTVNEIGIAFSKTPEGPFIKYEDNPIVGYDPGIYGKLWGVGQPSLINVDGESTLLLLYTRGDINGTRTVVRRCNLSDMSKPVIGEEIELRTDGLTEIDGSTPTLNNADFMLDYGNRRIYVIRDRHPHGVESPRIISSQIQIAYTGIDNDYIPNGKWTVLTNISKEHTGYHRNHNSCLVSNKYGMLPEDGRIEAVFTSSMLGEWDDFLWTYRLHSIIIGKIY